MNESYHEPVLLDEVIRWLDPKPDGVYIDGTVGGGGHSKRILEMMAGRGRLLGLDRDPEALAAAERRLASFGSTVRLRRAPFSTLLELAREEGIREVDGILLDLGVSSAQLDRPERGMSYRSEAPLDLRMDPSSGETAADFLARADETEIADVIYRFGEEHRSRAIARRIARSNPRPRTTGDLAALVREVAPRPAEPTLSRVFQALRIAVNGELEELAAALPAALTLLTPGGRLVVISYHSLEDRAVKEFIRAEAKGCVCPPGFPICRCGRLPRLEPLTRRVVRPSPEEVALNRRSRSARLRAARRLPPSDPNHVPPERP